MTKQTNRVADTEKQNIVNSKPFAKIGKLLLAAAILASGFTLGSSLAPKAEAAPANKVTICHRTHATTNPYRRITVSLNSITKSNGHGDEGASNTHNKGTGVFDPNYTYPPSEKLWNDIIPDETIDGGSATITMNYFDAGYAIYNGTVFDGYDYAGLCGKMTAKAFYDTELAAGRSPEDIFADLDEQEANEDEALKRALGGSFSGSDPSTWDSLISVTTDNPTDVGATSGTLNGTIKVGATSTDSYFH
jgi:hypothetical protein